MSEDFPKPWQATFLNSLPVMDNTPVLDELNNGSSSGVTFGSSTRSYPTTTSSSSSSSRPTASYSRSSASFGGSNATTNAAVNGINVRRASGINTGYNNAPSATKVNGMNIIGGSGGITSSRKVSKYDMSQPPIVDARASPVFVEKVLVIETEEMSDDDDKEMSVPSFPFPSLPTQYKSACSNKKAAYGKSKLPIDRLEVEIDVDDMSSPPAFPPSFASSFAPSFPSTSSFPSLSSLSSNQSCGKKELKVMPSCNKKIVPPCAKKCDDPKLAKVMPMASACVYPKAYMADCGSYKEKEKEKEACKKKKSVCMKDEDEYQYKSKCKGKEGKEDKEDKLYQPSYSACTNMSMKKEKEWGREFEIIQTLEFPELSSFDVICDKDKRVALVECEHRGDISLMAATPENECIEFSHYFNTETVGQYFYDIRDVSLLVVNCENYFYISPVKIAEPCKKGMKADIKLKIKHFCGPKVLRDGIYPIFCSVPECDKFVCATRAAQVVWADYLVECFGHMFKELEHNKTCIESMAKKVCQKDFSVVPCDKLAEFLDCLNCNIKKWKYVMKQLDVENSVKEVVSYLTCPPQHEQCAPKCEKKC